MKRILIVEDDPSIRKALALGLPSEGYEVHTAIDGRTGIQKGRERQYALLICDLRLPDLDGFEVIKAVRTADPGICIVIITGHASTGDRLEAGRLRVAEFLDKPVSLAQIRAAVQRCIRNQKR